MGINSCSSSNELGAQDVLNLTKDQSDHTCRKRTCLLPVVSRHVLLAAAEDEVSGCSERLQTLRGDRSKGSQGTAGMAGRFKKVKNRKAICFTLLKRITNSKRRAKNLEDFLFDQV